MDPSFVLTVVLDEAQSNEKNWILLHQCLLMLLDSPLNQSGHLQAFIRLVDGRIIKIHREARLPRTFVRFEQLFCNFLGGCDVPLVATQEGHVKLLQFVGKSNITGGSDVIRTIRIANLAPNLANVDQIPEMDLDGRFKNSSQDATIDRKVNKKRFKKMIVYIDFGRVDFNILGEGRETEYEVKMLNEFPEESHVYSISRYPLAAPSICVKLTTAFERVLEVF